MIVGDDLPQLKQLLWSRADAEVTEEEAFALYEANRAWVKPAEMTDRERLFFEELVAHHGAGIFLG